MKGRSLFLICTLSCYVYPLISGAQTLSAKQEFGSCVSDATRIERGTFDMGALCQKQGSCRRDVVDVIWIENASIRIAVSPQMGGAVVYLAKKGLDANNGVPCSSSDTLCKEQWIGNRFSDRGRQLQIDLSDQSQNDLNPLRTMPDPSALEKRVPVSCSSFGMNPSDPSTFLLFGGCGWNPTMAGAWQGPIGWSGDEVHLPGEVGGCAVTPDASYCTSVSMLGEGGSANLDTRNLPPAQSGKVYVRSGLYMNFRRNYPPIEGDTAALRNDIWSEQWYCLRGDNFQMQVDLHHVGTDFHWDLGQGNSGSPAISELASFWLQGPFDTFYYEDKDGRRKSVPDAQVQATSPIDKMVAETDAKWFGVGRKSVSHALFGSIEVPKSQEKIANFLGFGVTYWGAAGVRDREYVTAEGAIISYLNVDPNSEYFWNINSTFAIPVAGSTGFRSGY